MRFLHFADAHIDMANYGRLDPATGLPLRILDFLKALDEIVESAVTEKVDLVIFAGDAYKDRNPQPTYQREWEKRIMRLSQAGIPTLLLVGNHDVGRAANRAHTLEEFRTLQVPHVFVADRIQLWTAEQLGLHVQILAIPWVSRSVLMTRDETVGLSLSDIDSTIHDLISQQVQRLLDQTDPALPLIITAHASVDGATYGSERMVMLGHEVILSQSLLRDPRVDYVALGHIHKHQDLNPKQHPPIVYPGSIERIDFGEAKERKGFVLGELERGRADWRFVPLNTRRFFDYRIDTPDQEGFMSDIVRQLPDPDAVVGAICRLQLVYPIEWEPQLDEAAILRHFEQAFSFQLQKHRVSEKRARLGDTVAVEQLAPLELLERYWLSIEVGEEETAVLQSMAQEIFAQLENAE